MVEKINHKNDLHFIYVVIETNLILKCFIWSSRSFSSFLPCSFLLKMAASASSYLAISLSLRSSSSCKVTGRPFVTRSFHMKLTINVFDPLWFEYNLAHVFGMMWILDLPNFSIVDQIDLSYGILTIKTPNKTLALCVLQHWWVSENEAATSFYQPVCDAEHLANKLSRSLILTFNLIYQSNTILI